MEYKLKRVFLDIDGVLSNFDKKAIQCLQEDGLLKPDNVDHYEVLQKIGLTKEFNDLSEYFDISNNSLWKSIEKRGIDFWASLEKMPWFDNLIKLLEKYAPITLLTAARMHWTCPAGKLLWIQKHFGEDFKNWAITVKKEPFANPEVLLIDDREKNVNKFIENGGNAILFPGIFNKNKNHVGYELKYIITELKKMFPDVHL